MISPQAIPPIGPRIPLHTLRWVEGLFDCLSEVAFFAKDREGCFVGANAAFVRLLRQNSRSVLLGKTDLDFFPRHIAEGYQEDDRRVMETGTPLRHRLEVVPTDDLLLEWREAHKFPVEGANGRVVGLAGITLRVSEGFGTELLDPSLAPVLEHIAKHYSERIRVEELARLAGLSPRSLERRFHARFQTSPLRYLKQVRINAASHALSHTPKPIAQIAMECGFSDQSHLTTEFARIVGETPLRFRRRIRSGAQ